MLKLNKICQCLTNPRNKICRLQSNDVLLGTFNIEVVRFCELLIMLYVENVINFLFPFL